MTKHVRITTVFACLVAGVLVSASACTNPETPEGYEGYIYHKPLLFGHMEYRSSQRGAATAGLSWRLYSINIDTRKKSFTEHFKLLTRDNLSVQFEIDTRIEIKRGQSRVIVDEWGGENWYEWNVKEPLRTIVRETVTQFSATDIQIKTQAVRERIEQHLNQKYSDESPISIESVDIGEISFPKEVTTAIQNKIAKKQELRRQEYVLAKTRKEAAIRVLEALKVAKQQRIISSTLDPLYVQQRAVQVYRTLASSSNKTILMLPNTPDGTGMPLVLAKGNRKILSPADEKLLKQMEDRYMKIAKEPATDDKPGTAGSLPAKVAPAVDDRTASGAAAVEDATTDAAASGTKATPDGTESAPTAQ